MQIREYKISVLLLLFNLFVSIPVVFAAETDWSVHLRVSVPDSRGDDGTVWNHLIAGIKNGAADSFDRGWDTLSMVEVDDPVQAIFDHGVSPEDSNDDGLIDNWTCHNQEEGYTDQQCSLWRDLKALGPEKVWKITILSTVNGGTVSLHWKFDNKPADMDISLVDLTDPANAIDMKNAELYLYTNTFDSGKKYGIRHFELRMKVRGFYMLPPALPDATIGSNYGKNFALVGIAPSWSVIGGEIPPGMTLDVNTGELTGIPTEFGEFKFTLKGEDPSNGQSKIQDYVLHINSMPRIDSLNLPDGLLGSEYSGQVVVSGGSKPITYNVMGNLPEGLFLDKDSGIISGTSIVPGIYNFAIGIADANGATDSMAYEVAIKEPDDKAPPSVISDLRVAYTTNSSALLMWSAPLDDSIIHTATVYDIRYIENCSKSNELNESTWTNATEVIGEPRPQYNAIQTYSLPGVKSTVTYCIAIKSIDAMRHTSAISNVVMLSSSDIRTSNISEMTSAITLSEGYNLISIPMLPVMNEREYLFGLTVGSPVALYRWYSAHQGIAPPQYYLESVVQPGFGYLLYSPAENVKLVVDGFEIKDSEYIISLQNGWNMIGNPYSRTILLADIMVKKVGSVEVKTFLDAVKAGWIGNSLYQLKDGNYDFASFNDDPPAELAPWVGYWININEIDGVGIIFRRPLN